jgi:HEAT repeat protein
MGREHVARAWEILEQGADLETSLLALEELEEWVAPEDEQSVERLKAISRRSSSSLATALDRALLRFQRRAQDWEILTQNIGVGDDPHRLASSLRKAKEILTDSDPEVRLDFLDECRRSRRFDLGPALATHILLEKDPRVLAAMAYALGTLGTTTSVSRLKTMARHASPEVRLGAIRGLALQRGQTSLTALVERLGDEDKENVWTAIEVLETLPLIRTQEILEVIPLGRLPDVKIGAVRLLKGSLRNPRTLKLLRHWLHEGNTRLSAEALVALASVRDPTAEQRFQELAVNPNPKAQQVLTLARMAYEAASEDP